MKYRDKVFILGDRMRLITLNKKYVSVQAKYGPSKVVKIPLVISPELSSLVALVIGDGHLMKEKFKTTIESSNKNLLKVLVFIIKKLFDIKASIKNIKKRDRKKQTYHLTVYSKAVQELFSIVFNISRGKKSNIVKVPEEIYKGENKIKEAFIIGLLAAEGSRKGKYNVRICSASKDLVMGTQRILLDLHINSRIESWINKKYKKEYYSLSFKRYHLDSLMRGCRSGQTGLILSIFKKVTGDHA